MPKLYFNNRVRQADLPLHNGKVPSWLYERMTTLGAAIMHSVVLNYGRKEAVKRLSDPFWFQSLGCVLGMDWHSSGITTSVLGSLKAGVNPMFNELGIYFCGGRGKHSLQTPDELLRLAERTGLNGDALVRSSKLVAKVDNTAIQDGFQLYLHSFIISRDGDWAVVQQGMNGNAGMARRYHWSSEDLDSYHHEPHASIIGVNQGVILNLTDARAEETKNSMISLVKEDPAKSLAEVSRLIMPLNHEVRAENVNLKRLGSVIAFAHEHDVKNFDELLLLKGMGPAAIESLTLVSEVIHGTQSRFEDPARFSFAHGGKDGHPFPVPLKTYDQTIEVLKDSIERAKIGIKDKNDAIKGLHAYSMEIEKSFIPNDNFDKLIQQKNDESWRYGGMSVYGPARKKKDDDGQLSLLF